jgi:hypothetical protein
LTDPLQCDHLQLPETLARRKGHIMSFVKLERSLALIVFDDGMVWHFNNDPSQKLLVTHSLPIPFVLVTQVVFEPQQAMICLENESAERIFYKFEDDSWQHFKLDVTSKY